MGWAAGIEDLVAVEERKAAEGEAATAVAPGQQVKRADTMFQERFDYLSEKKRKEYAAWKAGILGRIKELERDGDAMEIDG